MLCLFILMIALSDFEISCQLFKMVASFHEFFVFLLCSCQLTAICVLFLLSSCCPLYIHELPSSFVSVRLIAQQTTTILFHLDTISCVLVVRNNLSLTDTSLDAFLKDTYLVTFLLNISVDAFLTDTFLATIFTATFRCIS